MRLSEQIADIESCDNLDALKRKMHRIAQGYGFASYNFLDVGDPNTELPFYTGTVAVGFETAYRDNAFVTVDPYVSKARRTNLPFNWGEFPAPFRVAGRKSGAERLFEAARDFGFNEGFIVPFHFRDPTGRFCSALVVFIWADQVQKFRFLMSERGYELQLVTIYWAQRVIDLVAETERSRPAVFKAVETVKKTLLTDQERTVLRWAAHGKTAGETADIMKLSSRTVEKHFTHAIARLEVVNKTQAVAKAIYGGFIDL